MGSSSTNVPTKDLPSKKTMKSPTHDQVKSGASKSTRG